MKKLYTLVALLATATAAHAQLANGLIAHWGFNGNVNDISGNNFNGTAHNITYTSGKKGGSNSAAIFNGASSYVSTAYQNSLNLNEYSICAVLKVSAFNTGTCQESVVLATGLYPTTGSISLSMGDNPFDNDNCSNADTSKQVFRCSAGSALPNGPSEWQYTPTTRTNRWYNVIATFSNNTFKIYVDGQLVNTTTAISGSIGNNTNLGLNIGRNPIGGASSRYWFNGIIDDIQLYSRVLADSEIVDHYNDVYINQPFSDTNLCFNHNFTLNYTTIGSYPAGNVFTAQLSNATGSFANPVNIGSVTAQTSGTINCTIPPNTIAGTKYRIRIVSSKGSDISEDNGKDISIGNTTVNISASPSNNVGPYTPVSFSSTVNYGGSSPSYQWRKNGIDISGATAGVYNAVAGVDFNSNDDITLFVTGSSPCTSVDTVTSNSITMIVNLNVNSLHAVDNIQVAPNPSNGRFTLSGKVKQGQPVQLQIINTTGQVVYKETLIPNNVMLQHQITLPQVGSGVYRLQLQSGQEFKTMNLNIK